MSEQDIDEAMSAAWIAFNSYRTASPADRAALLTSIADKLDSLEETIVARGQQETGLPPERLISELSRTTRQLRLFGNYVSSGQHEGLITNELRSTEQHRTSPEIFVRNIPLGPVVVFGASNFPLAFSVAGGDTAAALAAGCPVVVKAHNAHPGLSEIVGKAVAEAVDELGFDAGIFSLLFGSGTELGQRLVSDPRTRAVGFTGSRSGGDALARIAAARPMPIPVYAEMSAINPVFITEQALQEKSSEMAEGLVASFTGSAGQLCTAPGVIFVPDSDRGESFVQDVARRVHMTEGQTMLTADIAGSWQEVTTSVLQEPGVEALAQGNDGDSANAPGPVVLQTDVGTFNANEACRREAFGPSTLIVRYRSIDDLRSAVQHMEGQLTATVHHGVNEEIPLNKLISDLELLVGRIVFNGWPTGVEVGPAMVHGGPYPATSDSRTTSVGTSAIYRFLRPVAYQNVSEGLRPQTVGALSRG